MSVTVLGPHRIGVGDLLDADFQRELWSGASAQAGTPIADWPYNAAIDKDARRRSAAAGMRNGKNTCITAAWDQYNDGGGGWPAYVRAGRSITLSSDGAGRTRSRTCSPPGSVTACAL